MFKNAVLLACFQSLHMQMHYPYIPGVYTGIKMDFAHLQNNYYPNKVVLVIFVKNIFDDVIFWALRICLLLNISYRRNMRM